MVVGRSKQPLRDVSLRGVGRWVFDDRLGAVALGLVAASGTTFLVLAALWHFTFVGARALPLL